MPSKRPAPPSAPDPDHGESFAAFRAPLSKRRTPRPLHPAQSPSPPRKSDRRRSRTRAFPDSTTLARALLSHPFPPLPSASSSLPGGKMWNDADEISLLAAAVDFRSRTGASPRLPDMADLYDSLRDTISPHLDQAKVYYKLKRMKSKFMHTALGDNVTLHERRIHNLSAKVWPEEYIGSGTENHVVDDEGMLEGDRNEGRGFPALTAALVEHWKLNGGAISKVSLEKGLKGIDVEAGRAIEAKWRKQVDAEARSRIRWHELAKEVYGMMNEAARRLGP